MPQLFQVLKCYKCLIFQVHQTKKSNKWECKLCGEKQSNKRHYGLGTGKECRLHVQKLNGIRSELDELNESIESKNELESDHENVTNLAVNTQIVDKALKNGSKWTNFIDKTELVQEPEINENIHLGNIQVVLENPAKKRRKFNAPKVIHKSTAYTQETELPARETDYQGNNMTINSDLSDRSTFCIANSSKLNATKLTSTSGKGYRDSTENIDSIVEKVEIKTNIENTTEMYVPPKVNKNSKWAQFTDSSDENGRLPINRESPKIPYNLFSQCDERELDDVLNL